MKRFRVVASNSPTWFSAALVLLLGLVFSLTYKGAASLWFHGLVFLPVLFSVFVLCQPTMVVLSKDVLTVKSGFAGTALPHTQLYLKEARLIDLRLEPNLQPQWRTFGVGLPGYCHGWFVLRNAQYAYAHITNLRRVVDIPIQHPKAQHVLLSLENPEDFLLALQQWQQGAT